MRLLRQAKIPFETSSYTVDETDLSGVHAAHELGVEPERVFKTLVARGDKTGINVFVIPVAEELDLKKCAAASGNKKLEMVHVKDLLGLTGYVRGGCSPVGMKKQFPTFIDASAQSQPTIMISAGKIGMQVELDPKALCTLIGAKFAEITV